ncbi:hypothetical protein C0J52_20809 [Blattella germanica]|nr:hypothetical protein C0J52_20809 [Blattella germanica]
MACNLVALDVIITLAFSTVAIAQLYDSDDEMANTETIPYICQPCGSVMSGILVQYLGRKRSLMLVNIPFLIGWILVFTANSFTQLLAAQVLLGITIGLCEAPLNTYYGEISQPELRGILAGTAGMSYQTGFFLEYLLGTITHWRTVAMINAAFPIVTAIYFSQVPEAPIWLLSKGRSRDAEKSLCWLRGWVQPSAVREEFSQLVRYNEETKRRAAQAHTPAKSCMHTARELLRAPTLRPLSLVIPFFFFVHWSGLTSIRPYMVHVFERFRVPLDPSWATVVTAGTAIAGSFVLLLLVHSAGKRFLSLTCTALCSVCCFLLGFYAHFALPQTSSWLPLALFLLLSFSQSIVSQMPWNLLCEVFPYRTRGLASGITAAACYIFLFFSSKMYLDIETAFLLEGAFWFYGSISCLGFIFLYFRMLETEGKTLEEIEQHYTEGRKSILCNRIAPYVQYCVRQTRNKQSSLYLNNTMPVDMESKPIERQERTASASRFREILSQVLAMSAANMVVVVLTIALYFSTLVIAEVHNKEGPLCMDDSQASWFGGVLSGFIVQKFGRKRALFFINIPYCLGIVMLSVAPSVTVLFFANALLGITVGFTEAPINSYFGEIYQPELRSILTGSSGLFYNGGMFFIFVLGTFLDWKTTGAVLTTLPIISMICLYKVPESPIWLIANGRVRDAEAALCWLRGWVQPRAVQQELNDLVNYHQNVTLNAHGQKQVEPGPDSVSLINKDLQTGQNNDLKENIDNNNEENPTDKPDLKKRTIILIKLLLERETRRPLALIVLSFAFCGFGGMYSIRPFLIEVQEAFHVPISAMWGSVVITIMGFISNLLLILIINRTGKRMCFLVTTAMSAICCLLLGLYAYLVVVPAARTGDQSYLVATWLPLLLFSALSFLSTMQGQIPWLLVAECFPYRTRGIGSGMAAASYYVMIFLAINTYLTMEHNLQLYGTFWSYGAISVVGFVYLYFQLPETEGKTLEEIEQIFAAKKLRFNFELLMFVIMQEFTALITVFCLKINPV